MDSKEYTKSVIKKNYKVYIDTSSLMEIESLEALIESVEEELMIIRRKIIVPKAVWMELLKHLDSEDETKSLKSSMAVNIICTHRNIFYIEDKYVDHENLEKAFADKDLLARLVQNKTECHQLLITNDKKLGADALHLNSLESCEGRMISVCSLSGEGELRACKSNITFAPKEERIKTVPVDVPTEDKYFALKIAGASVFSTILGIAIGKYAPKIIKFI